LIVCKIDDYTNTPRPTTRSKSVLRQAPKVYAMDDKEERREFCFLFRCFSLVVVVDGILVDGILF